MLDLGKGARPDEQGYFHLQSGPPVPHISTVGWLWKKVTWSNLFLADQSPGRWESWWLIGNSLHIYKGTAKVDGTRTRMYWRGQLDDGKGLLYTPDPNLYVVTTLPKEMLSVRLFTKPSPPHWDSMGGA